MLSDAVIIGALLLTTIMVLTCLSLAMTTLNDSRRDKHSLAGEVISDTPAD